VLIADRVKEIFLQFVNLVKKKHFYFIASILCNNKTRHLMRFEVHEVKAILQKCSVSEQLAHSIKSIRTLERMVHGVAITI
jgi:hypothetical protein